MTGMENRKLEILLDEKQDRMVENTRKESINETGIMPKAIRIVSDFIRQVQKTNRL